jgi:hypothetical protein
MAYVDTIFTFRFRFLLHDQGREIGVGPSTYTVRVFLCVAVSSPSFSFSLSLLSLNVRTKKSQIYIYISQLNVRSPALCNDRFDDGDRDGNLSRLSFRHSFPHSLLPSFGVLGIMCGVSLSSGLHDMICPMIPILLSYFGRSQTHARSLRFDGITLPPTSPGVGMRFQSGKFPNADVSLCPLAPLPLESGGGYGGL